MFRRLNDKSYWHWSIARTADKRQTYRGQALRLAQQIADKEGVVDEDEFVRRASQINLGRAGAAEWAAWFTQAGIWA